MIKGLSGRVLRIAKDVRVFGPAVLKIYGGKITKQPIVQSHFRDIGQVSIRPRDSDLHTFRQVFHAKEYSIAGTAQEERVSRRYREILAAGGRPLIIDAGANVGAAAIWFAKLYPLAKVVAVEPEPGNAAMCRANAAAFENVQVIEGAVAGRGGTVEIGPHDFGWAAQTRRSESGSGVPAFSITDLTRQAGDDAELLIVKVDIEGFESDLFAGETQWIDEVMMIFVEPHDWLLPGQGTSQSMQKAVMNGSFEMLLRGENLVLIKRDAPRSSEKAPLSQHHEGQPNIDAGLGYVTP